MKWSFWMTVMMWSDMVYSTMNDKESLHDRMQHDWMYKWMIEKVNMIEGNMIICIYEW